MSPRTSAVAKRRRPDARTLSLTYPQVPRLNARRIDICLTAARIFVERGYDASSVNDVAKALGITKAGLYHYISSKETLLYEIVNYSMDALAKHYFFMYPVMPMTKYSLPTYEHFEYINAPITIFHGTKDGVIPYKHAQWLTDKKKGTELITIGNGRHNNLADFPLYQHKLDSILNL